MLDKCANPECAVEFDYREGRFFRFRLSYAGNGTPVNVHSVQHLWLCGQCAETHTLQHHKERGIIVSLRFLAQRGSAVPHAIRAAWLQSRQEAYPNAP